MEKSPTWSDLISPQYLGEQRRLHLKPEGYGGRGAKWATVAHAIIETAEKAIGRKCTVLDYGCGQGSLGAALRVSGHQVSDYDPAVREFEAMPYPADVVLCTDMLEHAEPEKIDNVLKHLRSLTGFSLFTVISTVPTEKKLSDGRQAHILLRDEKWWGAAMLAHRFEHVDVRWHNPKPEKQIVAEWRPI